MKKILLLISALMQLFGCAGQADTLLAGYNNSFYTSALSAAKAVAMPFLLQQGYLHMAGVTASDSAITYDNIRYQVQEVYLNPAAGYFVSPADYGSYGISNYSTIWPGQFPNILFQSSDTAFNAESDCVGYLTRLLSATGDTSSYGNAYLNIINTIHAGNAAPFAYRGYVATAYSFAVAFPTLPVSAATGWQYISGNVEDSLINAYNHVQVSSLGPYIGVRQGGFGHSLPGDILAFGYSQASSSNGHIMVMETTPLKLTAGDLSDYFPAQTIGQATALLASRNIYSVPVFDCSGIRAHFSDSRTQMSGIGHGTLLILTDPTDDAPTGFIFDSTQVTYSTLHMDTLGASVYAISVGRFVTTYPAGIAAMSARLEAAIKVFPNPGTSDLHIVLPEANGQITICTIDGQVVFNEKGSSQIQSIDATQWCEGIYFIKYQRANGPETCIQWIKQ